MLMLKGMDWYRLRSRKLHKLGRMCKRSTSHLSFRSWQRKEKSKTEKQCWSIWCMPNWSSCTNLSTLDDVEENGYQCVCSLGYAPSATDPETNIVTEFSDIDECDAENSTHNCDSNATCNNNAGGYICSCNEGFRQTGDGHVDECSNWWMWCS